MIARATLYMRRRAATLGLIVTVWLCATCDVPTDLPRIETRLLVPAASTSIGVSAFLPASVQVAGSVFRISLAQVSFAPRRLGDMCGVPCAALQGQLVTKPAFSDSISTVVPLPADVLGATLVNGAFEITLRHDYGFDVLRPSGSTQTGTLRITARSGTQPLGTLTVQEPFPSGVTLRRTLTLNAAPINGDIVLSLTVSSPAGGSTTTDRVHIDNNATLSATAVAQAVEVSQTRVRVQNRNVSTPITELDLTGFDASVVQRTRGSAIVLALTNPFGAQGTLQLRLSGSGIDLTRPLQLAPNSSVRRIEFSETETKTLLGRVLALQVSGPVTGMNGEVIVLPTQSVVIHANFELLLEIS